jgi:hypothetical protein
MFKQMGIIESRVIVDIDQDCKVSGYSRKIFTSNDENQITQLLSLYGEDALNFKIIQV